MTSCDLQRPPCAAVDHIGTSSRPSVPAVTLLSLVPSAGQPMQSLVLHIWGNVATKTMLIGEAANTCEAHELIHFFLNETLEWGRMIMPESTPKKKRKNGHKTSMANTSSKVADMPTTENIGTTDSPALSHEDVTATQETMPPGTPTSAIDNISPDCQVLDTTPSQTGPPSRIILPGPSLEEFDVHAHNQPILTLDELADGLIAALAEAPHCTEGYTGLNTDRSMDNPDSNLQIGGPSEA
ncbi:hypothetical protein LXA43DRAFT_1062866 [Ganoderma leucocontextum]|nr:hypothetical protein LXA43DRAFT_1062866 [Ganoderma leucocontextum]